MNTKFFLRSLYLLRILLIFSPGYIHPDEFFQGGQVGMHLTLWMLLDACSVMMMMMMMMMMMTMIIISDFKDELKRCQPPLGDQQCCRPFMFHHLVIVGNGKLMARVGGCGHKCKEYAILGRW